MTMIMLMFVGALWRKTVENSATILYMGDDDDVVVQGSWFCWLRDEQSQVVAAVVLDFLPAAAKGESSKRLLDPEKDDMKWSDMVWQIH